MFKTAFVVVPATSSVCRTYCHVDTDIQTCRQTYKGKTMLAKPLHLAEMESHFPTLVGKWVTLTATTHTHTHRGQIWLSITQHKTEKKQTTHFPESMTKDYNKTNTHKILKNSGVFLVLLEHLLDVVVPKVLHFSDIIWLLIAEKRSCIFHQLWKRQKSLSLELLDDLASSTVW